MFKGGEMMFQNSEKDMFGHAKLGGIGDVVSAEMKNLTAGFNKGNEWRPLFSFAIGGGGGRV